MLRGKLPIGKRKQEAQLGDKVGDNGGLMVKPAGPVNGSDVRLKEEEDQRWVLGLRPG